MTFLVPGGAPHQRNSAPSVTRDHREGEKAEFPRLLDGGTLPKNRTMNEVKEAIRTHLENQRWDAFFTATFARPQRYSHSAIDKVVNTLSEPRLRPVKMFVAAEPHYLGNWHCHGLLEFPRRENGELFHEGNMLGFQRNNLSRLGFNKVDIVNDLNACSVYLSKYLVKDDWHGDWKMTGRKKFWQGCDCEKE